MHNQALNNSDPFNQSLKKSILWNAVEPGDPYDIKKSTIAKLPGDKKIFLGNKLQVVCLLQAAEIERLALHLQEYKVRLRQIQKNGLDRHSYQIQIKELAARIQGEDQIRSQNSKLKNFIDRLNVQLEECRQKLSTGSTQLNTKYQQALLQIQHLTEQNTKLNNEVEGLRRILQNKSIQYSHLQRTIKQLEQERLDNQNRISQYQDKFELFGKEIQRLNYVLKTKTQENHQLKQQTSEKDSFLHSKIEENQFLFNNQIKLSEELTLLKEEVRKSNYEQEQQKFREYEERYQKLSSQISYINNQLLSQRSQNQGLNTQMQKLRVEIDRLRGVNVQLEQHVIQIEQQNEKYQSNSAIIGKQIERLNAVIRTKIDQLNSQQIKLNRLTEENHFYSQQVTVLQQQASQFKLIHRKMQELEFELSKEQAAKDRQTKINNDLLKRQSEIEQSKIQQYQLRIGQLSQQLRKTSEQNGSLEECKRKLKDKISQNQTFQQQLKRVSRQFTQLKSLMIQEDISKRNSQQRIGEMTKKCSQYQKVINELSAQIQRLNQMLKAKLQEYSVLQNKIQYVNGENHRLGQQLRDHKDSDSKLQDYQNKFALISLEVQRLNNNLKLKLQQNSQLERHNNLLKNEANRLKDQLNQFNFKSSQNIHEVNEQFKRQIQQKDQEIYRLKNSEIKITQFQTQIQKLNHILKLKVDELRQKDNQLHRIQVECESMRAELRDARSKQKQLGDLERLNNLLRLKVEQAARWQSSNHELVKNNQKIQNNLEAVARQNTSLKNQLQQFSVQNGHLIEQLNQYKNKVNQILKEFQRLQNMLQSFKKENVDLKKQIYQLKLQLSGGNIKEKNQKLLEEIERLNKIIEQQKEDIKQLRLILSQDHSFEKRIRQQLSLIVILCAEIQTLRKRIEEKEKEVEDVRRQSLVPLKA